jgi:hypothetical protein
MVRLTQELLRPGAYRLPSGRTGQLTRENLLHVAAATKSLLEAGYEIPVLKKHATKGAPHGGPRKANLDSDHIDAQRVGRVAELNLHDDGSLHQVLEIDDEDSARDFHSGVVRHTSAELRPQWTDEEGQEHGPIVAHVALTTAPRHTTQPPAELLSEAVQFSLSEIECLASEESLKPHRAKIEAANIPPGMRKRLLDAISARQFSTEVDDPTLALADVLSILETSLPQQWRQTLNASPAAHSEGEAFFSGASITDERADQIARDQLRRAGLDR